MKKQLFFLCCGISLLFSCKKVEPTTAVPNIDDTLAQVACLDMSENFSLTPRFTQNNGKIYAWLANPVRPKIMELLEIDNDLSKSTAVLIDFSTFKYQNDNYYVKDKVLTSEDGQFILTENINFEVVLLDVKNKKWITGYQFNGIIHKVFTEGNKVFAIGTNTLDATKFYLYELSTSAATFTTVQVFIKKIDEDIAEPIVFNSTQNVLSLNIRPQNTSVLGERMQNFRVSDGKQQNISLFSSKKFSQTYTFDESKCFVIEINGTLKAFDYNGVEITWNSGISSSSNQFSNIVVGGEYLYFSPHDGFMYCLDKKTGIVVWKSEYFNPSDTKLFIHNNILYAYSKNGNLNAFELKKGFSLLNQSFGEKGSDCFFNKENNLIYVATQRKICSFRPL